MSYIWFISILGSSIKALVNWERNYLHLNQSRVNSYYEDIKSLWETEETKKMLSLLDEVLSVWIFMEQYPSKDFWKAVATDAAISWVKASQDLIDAWISQKLCEELILKAIEKWLIMSKSNWLDYDAFSAIFKNYIDSLIELKKMLEKYK